MSKQFLGKVAVVTGAASGIGRVIATRFAQEGARTVIVDIDVEWGEAVATGLRSEGLEALFVKANVANSASVKDLFSAVLGAYGGVDILVNCAGVGVHKRVVDMTDEEWDFQVDVQLRGPFLMCREAATQMIKQGRGGRLINIGSTASAVARVQAAPHCASKAGVIMLTKVLALELGPYGITANVVAPGLTDISTISRHGGSTPDYVRNFVREVPIGRLARPEEIAEAVIYMASEGASFTTGQIIYIDGGYSSGKMGVQGSHVRTEAPPDNMRSAEVPGFGRGSC